MIRPFAFLFAAGLPLLFGACSVAAEHGGAAEAANDTGQAAAASSKARDVSPQGAVACAPAEATRVAVAMDHAAALGVRIASTGSTEGFAELFRETQDLNRTLSPSCNAFLARLGEDLKAEQAAGRMPSDRYAPLRNQRIYHDPATDTYTAPGVASCTPTSCFVN